MSKGKMIYYLNCKHCGNLVEILVAPDLRAELAAKDEKIKALNELVEVLDTANYLDSTDPGSPSSRQWAGLMGTAEKLRAKLDALRGAGREG